MTDEWEFRTARGRGEIVGSTLRVENSLVGVARKRWREQNRFLFAFSTLATFAALLKAVEGVRAMANGSAEPWQAVMPIAFAFVGLTLVWRVTRTRTVPLQHIESAERIGDERIRVTYADGDDTGETDDFEIETPTEDDADDALEILRLKGVQTERSGKTGEESDTKSKYTTVRARLSNLRG